MKSLRIVFCWLFVSISTWADSGFQTGDRWCAVGDSITHGGNYHHYVYLFYATRFPGRSIEFFNCGISGDTASGALRRLEGDILRHQPTVATIMLGMNDVGRNYYDPESTSPNLQQSRDGAIATHSANMKKLAEQLQAAGARLVFITPSIYDDTSTMDKPNLPGVNAALGRCAENARKLAQEFKGSVIDFHGAMSEINRREQMQDPKFTLVGGDRVHPGPAGHLVMAYLFLKAQGLTAEVAEISVDAGGKEEVSFTKLEPALPFPVPADCAQALKWVPFIEDLNQERLTVTALPVGDYKLQIDDQPIATYSSADLAKGINLATQTATPQYKQALEVLKLEDQRHDLVKRLRTIDYVEWKMGRQIGDPSEFDHGAAAQKMLEDPRNAGWPKGRIEEYLVLKPQQADLKQKLAGVIEEIRRTSQPKEHRFSLRK